MVRPILDVVIEAFEQEDFVFGLDVAVLGHPDVDADARLFDVFPIEPGVGHGLAGAINGNAAGPGSPTEIFAALVPKFVELANPSHGGAEIASLVLGDAATAR